ncbi:MAG: hypothetical protein ABR551_03175 [Gemmatimonadales bacterium]
MHDATPRRQFMGRVLGGAAAVAAAPLLPLTDAAARAQAANGQAAPSNQWDMSWVDRVRGDHRVAFDAPEVDGGLVLIQARNWMAGHTEVYGTRDDQMTAVLVIRHNAVPLVMNDALWERHALGEVLEINDPRTGQPARRNPFINIQQGDRTMVYADGGLDTLIQRGAVALACSLALRNRAGAYARRANRPAAEVHEEVLANLLPGVTVMPNGIFALGRAQEAGCGYMRST